jgi:hypothetical protein
MLFNAATFSALLETLSLTQGSSKPDPGAFVTSTAVANNATNAPGLTSSSSAPAIANFNKLPGLSVLEAAGPPQAPVTVEDNSCNVEPYTAPPPSYQNFAEFDEKMANIFRYRQQQSVNLGSW